jgi:hypothetical protein
MELLIEVRLTIIIAHALNVAFAIGYKATVKLVIFIDICHRLFPENHCFVKPARFPAPHLRNRSARISLL